ncbi:MAG: bactofilin family protein [Roseiflexaceae bacterium]|jgi:cytoskeletal protein CcmA (bactofilin family)
MTASILVRNARSIAISETIIDSKSMFIGSFSGNGNMIIEGIVEGDINVEGELSVSPLGRVRAHIRAAKCIIAGAITGKITARHQVTIENTAKAWCDIQTNELTVAPGATFKGNCVD